MGHSFGGTLTQLLLARGLGAAGVVIDSAPTEGVRVNPLSQLQSLFPVLKNPANRNRAVGLHPRAVPLRVHEHPVRARTRTRCYERYPSPRPGTGLGVRAVRELQAGPPGHLGGLRQRRPRPAAVHRRAAPTTSCRRRSTGRTPSTTASRSALTEFLEFAGRDHWTCAAPGWEAVADHALTWAWSTPAPDRRPLRRRRAPCGIVARGPNPSRGFVGTIGGVDARSSRNRT